MAFVVSRQRKIFYDLDGERGPYLLLYPSLWMDLQFWEEAGYLKVLQQEYRVLRMDPLGREEVMIQMILPIICQQQGCKIFAAC